MIDSSRAGFGGGEALGADFTGTLAAVLEVPPWYGDGSVPDMFAVTENIELKPTTIKTRNPATLRAVLMEGCREAAVETGSYELTCGLCMERLFPDAEYSVSQSIGLTGVEAVREATGGLGGDGGALVGWAWMTLSARNVRSAPRRWQKALM